MNADARRSNKIRRLHRLRFETKPVAELNRIARTGTAYLFARKHEPPSKRNLRNLRIIPLIQRSVGYTQSRVRFQFVPQVVAGPGTIQ
jgi:hypothetical protein